MCQQLFRLMISSHLARHQVCHPEQPQFSLPASVDTSLSLHVALSTQDSPSQLQGPIRLELAPVQLLEEEAEGGVELISTTEDSGKSLCCKLCNVTLNSSHQAQAHYQGKNHKKKIRNYNATNCYSTSTPTNPPDESSASVQQPLTAIAPTPPSNDSRVCCRVILATENDYCKLCDASFSSPAVAQAHYQGKNHAKRLRLAETQQNLASLDTSEMNRRKHRREGNEFKLAQNKRNIHNSQNTSGPYFNPRPRLQIPRDLAMCITPSGQFYCSMCNVGATEEAEFRQHLESKQHKGKVSEQRYRTEMECLGYA
ncbi:zinc finger matrin-type protein 3 [Protopterus annectens]|uniref:zinc finger matrin-type protein 3 n=1 Tax=Protopterus annectens TaxID=7888 RepID=UPI001CFA2732|nr:zinc finger matrin-type protein 3 [Protopterus annectens]